MPVRPCMTPGCSAFALQGQGYCHMHATTYRWERGSTRAWRQQRARILERDGHQCRAILANGTRCLVTHPLEVHHLEPGFELNVPDERLVTLCKTHHARAKAA